MSSTLASESSFSSSSSPSSSSASLLERMNLNMERLSLDHIADHISPCPEPPTPLAERTGLYKLWSSIILDPSFALALDAHFAEQQDDFALRSITMFRSLAAIEAACDRLNTLIGHPMEDLLHVKYLTYRSKNLILDNFDTLGFRETVREVVIAAAYRDRTSAQIKPTPTLAPPENPHRVYNMLPDSFREIFPVPVRHDSPEPSIPKTSNASSSTEGLPSSFQWIDSEGNIILPPSRINAPLDRAESPDPLPVPSPQPLPAGTTRRDTAPTARANSSETPSPSSTTPPRAQPPRTPKKLSLSSPSTSPKRIGKKARRLSRGRARTILRLGLPLSTTYPDDPVASPHGWTLENAHEVARADPIPFANFVCRVCKQMGHKHVNCPDYRCRICNVWAPRHYTCWCPQLKGKRILRRGTSADDFYQSLETLEKAFDADREENEDEALRQLADLDIDPVYLDDARLD